MCMEGIRVGRAMGSRWEQMTIGTTSRIVAPRDVRRVSIKFMLTDVASSCMINYNAAAAAAVGIGLNGTMPPHEFTVEKHGQLVYGPWHARAGADLQLVVAEATLNKE